MKHYVGLQFFKRITWIFRTLYQSKLTNIWKINVLSLIGIYWGWYYNLFLHKGTFLLGCFVVKIEIAFELFGYRPIAFGRITLGVGNCTAGWKNRSRSTVPVSWNTSFFDTEYLYLTITSIVATFAHVKRALNYIVYIWKINVCPDGGIRT